MCHFNLQPIMFPLTQLQIVSIYFLAFFNFPYMAWCVIFVIALMTYETITLIPRKLSRVLGMIKSRITTYMARFRAVYMYNIWWLHNNSKRYFHYRDTTKCQQLWNFVLHCHVTRSVRLQNLTFDVSLDFTTFFRHFGVTCDHWRL